MKDVLQLLQFINWNETIKLLCARILLLIMALTMSRISLAQTSVVANHDSVYANQETLHSAVRKVKKEEKSDHLKEFIGSWQPWLDSRARGLNQKKFDRIVDKNQRGLAVIGTKKNQSASSGSRQSWAVVIGINAYRALPRLRYAVNDAQAMADVLEKLGFSEIIRLMDDAATKAGIERTLNSLKDRVKPQDQVLIFYAGHGQTETLADGSKMGYWIPVDGDSKHHIATAISMDTIRLLSQAIPSKNVLFIIDSCYSGLALRQVWLTEREMLTRQIITAGRAGEQVLEEGGHGIFTRQLLRSLEGAADLNQDGAITASELGVFLQSVLPNISAGKQHPIFGRWSGEEEFLIPLKQGVTLTSFLEQTTHLPSTVKAGPYQPTRIMVVISEALDTTPVLHPSGEAEVIQRLIDAGYYVVDQSQIDEIRNPNEVQDILTLNNIASAKSLGHQYGADLIIVGEGVAEHVGNIVAGSRLTSSRARINVKAIDTKTGQVLTSHAEMAGGVDLAPKIAGHKALAKAGRQLAEFLIHFLTD